MTQAEIYKKAKGAKSPEELIDIARTSGVELTPEGAKTYFEAINHSGELSDDELDVSGGGCAVRAHGQKMVSYLNSCSHWRCNACNGNYGYDETWKRTYQIPKPEYLPEESLQACTDNFHHHDCDDCYYVSYERGAWWCNNKVHYSE